MKKYFAHKAIQKKGFTIIEVVVSLALFTVVMVVAAGALLAIVDADIKSHELGSVISNLNFALDDIVRDTRVGTSYVCGPLLPPFFITGTTTAYFDDSLASSTNGQSGRSGVDISPNCPQPNVVIPAVTYNTMFEYTNTSTGTAIPTVYYLAKNSSGGDSIFSAQQVGGVWQAPVQYTANEVNITDMRFYVQGATSGPSDGQPYVIITVDGFAGLGRYQSTFNIQTSVAQRIYD